MHTHSSEHTHREHTPKAVGSQCCGTRGAVGDSVPCSRAPQSWYWRWRERWLFTPPTYNPCWTWDSNPQPLNYKSDFLSIRPRLPHKRVVRSAERIIGTTLPTLQELYSSRVSKRGVPPEVHGHLHCFECVELQVVKTAPDSQLLDLLSVSRLVTVLNEADQCGVICKLPELDRGVFRCAVIGVEGEEQWGENTALRSSSADGAGDGCVFSQPH